MDADDGALRAQVADLTARLRLAEAGESHWRDLYVARSARSVEPVDSAATGGFTYARTLFVAEASGLHPYLLLSRGGWISVVRLGVVMQHSMSHAEAWAAAADVAREFYQKRLRVLPERLQERFHGQVNETADPYFLLDRVVAERHLVRLVRLVGVDREHAHGPGRLIKAFPHEHDVPDHVGQRVLLARDGARDALGEVVAFTADEAIVCRILDGGLGGAPS